MKSDKLNFLYNKREGVPLLRGRVYFLNFVMIPLYYYIINKHIKDRDTRLTFYIHLFCYLLNTLACVVFHNSSYEIIEKSTYRRIDYASIFLMIGGGGIPAYSLLMTNDFMVILGLLHWVLIFAGVFSSLLFNFCYTTKRVRSIVYVLIATPYYILLPLFIRSKYHSVLVLSIIAAITHTLGAVVYGLKFPNLIPGVFGYHELFHVFCLLGSAGSSLANFFLCKNDRSVVLQRVFESRY